jgi:hypothetical protein
MENKNGRSRFLLLPEVSAPSVSAKQPVLRRYSLARIPAQRADPLPARRPIQKRTRG